MEWQIDDAAPDDVGAIAGILGDWIREVGWMPLLHSRDEDIGFVADLIRRQTVRVARNGIGPIGILASQDYTISALYLAPAGRGKGIGKALIAEAKARQPELSLWVFEANTRAVEFYLREGFLEVERTDGRTNDEGLPDIRLVWRR